MVILIFTNPITDPISFNFYLPQHLHKPASDLYVYGVNFFSDDELRSYFDKYGRIKKIQRHPNNNYGFLCFESASQAGTAYCVGKNFPNDKGLRRHYIGDRYVSVRYQNQKQNQDVTTSSDKDQVRFGI